MNRTLQRLLSEGRLRRQRASRKEVADLLSLVRRSLEDAERGRVSVDLRFMVAYDAARQLATVVLRCAGYRAAGVGAHATIFEALPELLGPEHVETAVYFDDCRAKRNALEYHSAGRASVAEAEELLQEAKQFQCMVLAWLREHHPALWNQ